MNHSRPMAIPPINAGGRPAWLVGGGSCRRQQFEAGDADEPPAGSHLNKTCSKKNKNIQAAQCQQLPPDVPIPCGSQEAQRWDKLLTATTMSSTADYRTIYCVPIVSAGTGTGTLGAFGCCRKHHSTHVWERHRKHPQMGKPSDVVFATLCRQLCFGFGLVSRCRPADSWWSPDPREQVLKKEKRKFENKGQTQVTGPRRDLPDWREGALGRTGESSIETHFFHLSSLSLCWGGETTEWSALTGSQSERAMRLRVHPPFDVHPLTGGTPPGTSRRAEECGGLSGSSGSGHGGVAAVGKSVSDTRAFDWACVSPPSPLPPPPPLVLKEKCSRRHKSLAHTRCISAGPAC